MAQLKDSVVSGNLRVTDTTLTDTLQVTIIKAPTSSGGTAYGPGTSGQVLKSNGTSVYWGSDSNSVTGVKGNAESSYRTGNVNLTPANIGALPTTTNYAASSSVGGAATSANKLNTNAGSTNRPIYFSGGVPVQCDTPASGSWFKGVPFIGGTDGVMEIGKYIDFHNTNGSTADYDYRMEITTATMTLHATGSSNTLTIKSPGNTQLSFQTTSSGKAYTSSGITCYPLTTSGMTSLFNFGGNLVIGGGESAKTLYDNNYDTIKTVENEDLYLCADHDIHIVTGCQTYADKSIIEIDAVGKVYLPSTGGIIVKQRSDSNYVSATAWWNGGTAPNSGEYAPQIGQHNTGGDSSYPGSICILPYKTTTNPWGGQVGLFIKKDHVYIDGVELAKSGQYIPMSGSTGVTGNIEITKASGDVGFYAKRSDTGVEVLVGVGSGGTNHGIYSNKLGKWMVYGDATNVYLNGNAATATKLATARNINGVSFDGSANITIPRSIKHIHTASGTEGTTGWVKIARITVTKIYANHPMTFTIAQRGLMQYRIHLVLVNNGSVAAAAISQFIIARDNSWTDTDNYPRAYIIKPSDGIFDLYIKKTEGYDHIFVVDFTKADGSEGDNYSVTWTNVHAADSEITGGTEAVKKLYLLTTTNYAGSTSAGGAANSSNVLNSNTRMDYGWNGVNYFNISGTAGNAAKVNDTPTTAWWHIMRFNHNNNNGYYTDLAIPFNATSLYYKRITGGSVQNGGWVKVLDALNVGYVMSSVIKYDSHARRFTSSKTNSAWDAQAYSNTGYADNVYVSFRAGQTTMYAMIGLDANPSEDANYDKIDYCWYIQNNGALKVYESGTAVTITGHTTYASGDEFRVEYSCGEIRYYHNGTMCRSVTRAVSGKLFFDSSFHNAGNVYDFSYGTSTHSTHTAEIITSTYKSSTYVTSLTSSVITLSDAASSFGGWICGPTKNGRIAIASYQGDNDKLYFGYGERGRTTNSYVKAMTWDGPTNTLTADKFVGALQGNATTSSSWATARTLTLGGQLTGSVSIKGDANMTLNGYMDRAFIYDDNAVPANHTWAEYAWHKFAEVTIATTWTDCVITFLVSRTYSSSAENAGILSAKLRTKGSKDYDSAQLKWLVRNSGLSKDDFVMVYTSTSGTSTKAELWCRIPDQYSGLIFTVLKGHKRQYSTDTSWTLVKTPDGTGSTHGSSSYPTTGITGTIISSDGTITNSTTGTATSANALNLTHGNELNFSKLGSTGHVWFGYRWNTQGTETSGGTTITTYKFGNANGAQGLAGIEADSLTVHGDSGAVKLQAAEQATGGTYLLPARGNLKYTLSCGHEDLSAPTGSLSAANVLIPSYTKFIKIVFKSDSSSTLYSMVEIPYFGNGDYSALVQVGTYGDGQQGSPRIVMKAVIIQITDGTQTGRKSFTITGSPTTKINGSSVSDYTRNITIHKIYAVD